MNLFALLQNIGLFAIASGLLTWLIKSVISQSLSRDLEAFKAGLRRDAHSEIARLENTLRMAALEHQVRFSKLHDRQARVIARLYRLLVESGWSAAEYTLQGPRDESKATSSKEKVSSLLTFIQMNRLYFPTPLCASLDAFAEKLRSLVIGIDVYLTKCPESPTREMRNQQNEVMLAALKALEQDLPAMLKGLESEFRLLLGVGVSERGAENSPAQLGASS
jgi:hypothetical protein